MTPSSFTFKGYTYTVRAIALAKNSTHLGLAIEPHLPPEPLVLAVDGKQLRVRSASRTNSVQLSTVRHFDVGTLAWFWESPDIRWDIDQQVSLSLVTEKESRRTIWSDTLAVSNFFGGDWRGCFGDDDTAAHACSVVLTDRTFNVDGTDYAVAQLYMRSGSPPSLTFTIDKALPIEFFSRLILELDGELFPLDGGRFRGGNVVTMELRGQRWVDFHAGLTDGKTVKVSLFESLPYQEPDDDEDPLGLDDDDDDDAVRACTLVAPYWSGPTGGFTVMSAPDRTSVSVTCGGRTREYPTEDGLLTRLVNGRCPGGLRLEGATPGGWYWQHGDRNAAVAPFVCSEDFGGPAAVVPGGVAADVTDNGTLFTHDTARLVGIVPHLAGNECSEYVSPYWQGDGGVVVRPVEGRSTVRVRVRCGATYSMLTASPGDDGVAAELVRKDYCTDDEGAPRRGKLTVTGAAPGGWYWISGERNAAVAPLMCADLLGGPAAVDPGGVFSRATEDGTYFSHDADKLIGVVPHLASDRDE